MINRAFKYNYITCFVFKALLIMLKGNNKQTVRWYQLKLKIKINLLGGIISIIISLLVLIIIPLQISGKSFNPSKFALNAQYMPKFFAVIIFIMGLLLIFQSLVLKKEDYCIIVLKDELRVLIYASIICIYVILIPIIGYIISSIIMVVAALLYLKEKKYRYYLYAIIGLLVIYSIFVFGLKVTLP